MATDANVVSWFKTHERLILGTLALLICLFLFNKWIDKSAADADKKNAIAQIAAQNAAAQSAQATQVYQEAILALSKQIDALNANVAQRNTVLVAKQTAIKTETVPQVVSDWKGLIQDTDSNSIVSGTQGLLISEDAARRTVTQLEIVPTLQSNLADETSIALTYKNSLDKAGADIVDLNKQIIADNTECKAQISDLKARERKSKRNWFIAGFLTGIGTRILGHF